MKKIAFNDNWSYNGRNITLPHDAMLEAGRDPKSPGGSACGYFVGGVYEYEKVFDAPAEWEGKHIELQFEGVYENSTVTVNGHAVGGADYGYIPFFCNLDGVLNYGGRNTVHVTVHNENQPSSRWYTGGGIYRPVWLWAGEKAHIAPEGIQVSTLSIAPPKIGVKVSHTGSNPTVEILNGDVIVAAAKGENVEIDIPNARLWSEDAPNLYTCRVTLENGETAEDRFGIRQVTWNNTGLYINGKRTLLRGGCVHHDNGILGAAAHDGAEYRRVRLMKEAGYNAIRSSHNPCSRAMLEACDELGMYMMDEGWDMWFHHKSKFDYASKWRKNYLSDLKAMVSRDFNHPSVIFYSIGNEVSEPAKDEGIEKAKEMVAYLHGLDPNRAVTGGFNLMIISSAKKGKGIYDEESGGRKNDNDDKMKGMNSTMFNLIASMVGTGMNKSANSKAADEATTPLLDALDLGGYNYASGRYPLEGKAHPDRIIYGSETFPQDIGKNWEMVKKYPYLVGDFMWTAWDYLGEAGIGAWAYTSDGKGFNKPYPWMIADCGAFDILGTPGAPVAHARAAWGLDEKPWIGVQPVNHGNKQPAKGTWRGTNAQASWSWAGCEGAKAVVEVYSSAAKVEVFLNGRSLGKKTPKLQKAVYKTKYAPGKLEAVAYDASGREIGRNALASGEGEGQLTADAKQYGELTFVEIAVTDKNGIVEHNTDEKLTVTVEGGELLAFGSANPRTEESFLSGTYTTYYGRALAIVRKQSGKDAAITISGKTLHTVASL